MVECPQVACALRATISILLFIGAVGCTSTEFQQDAGNGVREYEAGLAALKQNDLKRAYAHFDMADFKFGFASRAYFFGAHYGTSEHAYRSVNVYRAIARMNMGVIHLRTGQNAKAIEKFSAALEIGELDPQQRAAILILRATAHLENGNRVIAAADHRHAISLDPRSEGARRLGEELSR